MPKHKKSFHLSCWWMSFGLKSRVSVEVVNSDNLKILQSSNLSTQNLTPTTPNVRVLRKVKGNLTCAQPGCAAEVMLQIYDPVEDGGKMGKMGKRWKRWKGDSVILMLMSCCVYVEVPWLQVHVVCHLYYPKVLVPVRSMWETATWACRSMPQISTTTSKVNESWTSWETAVLWVTTAIQKSMDVFPTSQESFSSHALVTNQWVLSLHKRGISRLVHKLHRLWMNAPSMAICCMEWPQLLVTSASWQTLQPRPPRRKRQQQRRTGLSQRTSRSIQNGRENGCLNILACHLKICQDTTLSSTCLSLMEFQALWDSKLFPSGEISRVLVLVRVPTDPTVLMVLMVAPMERAIWVPVLWRCRMAPIWICKLGAFSVVQRRDAKPTCCWTSIEVWCPSISEKLRLLQN